MTAILKIFFLLTLSITSMALSAMEPTRSYPAAIELAQEEVIRKIPKNIRFYEISAGMGKYSVGYFADYSVTLSVVDEDTLDSLGSCKVHLSIKKVPYAKQTGVIILEQVRNEYQTIAKIYTVHCTAAEI